MNKSIVIIFFTLLVELFSCTPEKVSNSISGIYSNKILLLGEGNFGNENATIDALNPNNKELELDIFKKINLMPVGDVVQCIAKIGDKYAISVNNSNKILWVTVDSFKLVNSSSISQPRYLYSTNNKLIATGKGGFTVFEPNGAEYIKVSNSYNNERIVFANSKIYIEIKSDWNSTQPKQGFLVYDMQFNLVDSIFSESIPNCSYLLGNYIVSRYSSVSFGGFSKISALNLSNNSIINIEENLSGYGDLADGALGNYNYIKESSVWQLNSSLKPIKLFDFKSLQNLYSIKSLSNGLIALCDAKDFNSRSEVYLYKDNSLFIQSNAPINTSFVFYAE